MTNAPPTDDNGKPLERSQEIMKLAFKDSDELLAERAQTWAPVWEDALRAIRDFTSTQAAEVEDEVNHPAHYTSHPSGVECIQITEHLNFNLGNSMKYIWRAGLKEADKNIQDLNKARFYIDREIARLSK